MGLCSNGVRLCRRMSNSNTAIAFAIVSTVFGVVIVCCGIVWLNCFLFTPNATLCETGLIYFLVELSAFFFSVFLAFCFMHDWRMTTIVCACVFTVTCITYILSYGNYLLIQGGWLPAAMVPFTMFDGFVYLFFELVGISFATIFTCGCIHCCSADCAMAKKELVIIDLENQAAESKRND